MYFTYQSRPGLQVLPACTSHTPTLVYSNPELLELDRPYPSDPPYHPDILVSFFLFFSLCYFLSLSLWTLFLSPSLLMAAPLASSLGASELAQEQLLSKPAFNLINVACIGSLHRQRNDLSELK